MKLLLPILFTLFTANALQAQGGCPHYNRRVFALELIMPDTWRRTNAPEVVLVNEDSVPYMNPAFYVDHRFVEADAEEFLQNRQSSLQQKHQGQVWTVLPRLPEELYTILIPKTPQRYQARIIVRHDNTIDTFYRHLPFDRSIDICKNYLYRENATQAITFDDGSAFTPLQIDLSKPDPWRTVKYPLREVYLRFDTKVTAPVQGQGTLLEVYHVRVYDGSSNSLIQTLPITGTLPFHPNNQYAHIEQFPLFKDAHPKGIPDFRILAEIQTDEEQHRSYHRFQQYVFDSTTSLYRLHPAISEAWNVKVDTLTGVITQYAVRNESSGTVIEEYQFTGGHWVFDKRRELPRVIYQPPAPVAAGCPEPVISGTGMLRLRVLDFMLGEYLIRDSLQLFNPCTEKQKLSIDQQYPEAKLFTVGDKIAPGAYASLLMQDHILLSKSIQLQEHSVRMLWENGRSATAAISYFAVFDKTAERDPKTGKVFRYVGEEVSDSLTVMVLEVDSLGRPTAYGPMSRSTGEKVGTWRTWREDGTESMAIVYSKRIHLTIYNPERLQKEVSVSARVQGVWRPLSNAPTYQGFIVYMPFGADSIHIRSGEAYCLEPIDRNMLQNYSYIGHALLLPGEPYVRSMLSKFPVTWDPDSYAILWDYVYLSKAFPNTDGREAVKTKLLEKYSALLRADPTEDQEVWLTVLPANQAQKSALLAQLQQEPGILALAQIAQLYNGQDTYARPSITIQFAPEMTSDSILAFAKERNAVVSGNYGAGNQFNLTFSDTLVNAAWIERMHALTAEPGVVWISFNWFSRVYPDEADE